MVNKRFKSNQITILKNKVVCFKKNPLNHLPSNTTSNYFTIPQPLFISHMSHHHPHSPSQQQQHSQAQNNFHIQQDQQGNPAIFIPVWQNQQSHTNQSYVQQKQQQIRMYKTKIHHLEKHIQEYDRNFQNLYAALNQATQSQKIIKKELIQTRTVLSQVKIQKESLTMHNDVLSDKLKQVNLTYMEERNRTDCLEQENKILKKRNQQLMAMLEQQQSHQSPQPYPQSRGLRSDQIQKYQASLTILQNQVSQQKRQKSRIQKALKDLQLSAADRQEEIRSMKRQLDETKQKLANGKKEIQKLQVQNSRMKTLIDEYELKLQQTEQKDTQISNQRQKNQSIMKKLKDKIRELQQALAQQKNEHESVRDSVSQMEQKLKQQKDKNASVEKQKRALEQQLAKLNQQLSSIVQQKDQQISRLNNKLSQAESTIQQLKKKLLRLQQDTPKPNTQPANFHELQQLQDKCKSLQSQLQNTTNELNKQRAKSRTLQTKLQTQYTELKNDKAFLMEELQMMKRQQAETIPREHRQKKTTDSHQELSKLQGFIKDRQKQLARAKQTISELQNQLSQSQQQGEEKQSTINQLQQQLVSMKQKMKNLEQKCRKLQKLSAELSLSSKKKPQQVEPSTKQCQSCVQLQNQLQQLQYSNEQMTQKLQQSQKQGKQKQQQIKKLTKQLDKHKKQTQKYKKQTQKLSKSIKQLQNQSNKLNQQLQTTKNDLQNQKQQLSSALQHKQQLQEELSELKVKLKELNDTLVSVNKQLTTNKQKEKDRQSKHKEELKKRQEELKGRDLKIKQKDQQIQQLLSQITELEREIQQLKQLLDEMRDTLRQKQKSDIRGITSTKSKEQQQLQAEKKLKEKLSKQNHSLKDLINSMKQQLAETNNKLSQLQLQLENKHQQINTLHQTLQQKPLNIPNTLTTTTDHTSCKSTQSRLTHQIKSLQTQLSLTNKHLAQTTKLLQEQYAKQAELQEEIQRREVQHIHKPEIKSNDHSKCNSEIQGLKTRIVQLIKDGQDKDAQLNNAKEKISEYESVIEKLKSQVKIFQKENTQLKQHIDQYKKQNTSTQMQNINKKPQHQPIQQKSIHNSASKGLSESDYQTTYQNQLQKLRRLLISSKSKPEQTLYPPSVPQPLHSTLNPIPYSTNSRQSSPYKKSTTLLINKSEDTQMIHSYYEQQIRKILSQLQIVKLQNAKLREYVLRVEADNQRIDTRTCANCRVLQDTIIDYRQKVNLLELQLSELKRQVYELRCLNEEYVESRQLRETQLQHHNSIEINQLLRQLQVYKSQMRRFEKLLRQQQRIYETKLVSKQQEIKLLHIRIESIRLGKQSDTLYGIKQRQSLKMTKERQTNTHSIKNSPSLDKENYATHIQRPSFGFRKGRTFNKTYLVGRQSLQKRQ